jgi:hypothetical protein
MHVLGEHLASRINAAAAMPFEHKEAHNSNVQKG